MALFIAASLASVAFASAAPPKVILHITLDDLGWHNVDWHRNASDPERVTPNMAALAKNGVILDQLYGYRMCTPSRTSFLSGRFPVHVNEVLGNPEDSNTGVPYNMTCIGTQMKLGGYKTHAVGKVRLEWSCDQASVFIRECAPFL
jgi:arylsulfatase A-like enzyme